MTAGYSGTPLAHKLGFKPGHRYALLHAPPEFSRLLGPLPDGVVEVGTRGKNLDLVMVFSRDAEALRGEFARAAARLRPAGMLWVSWPKKAARQETDLTEDVVRRIGLAAGLVDVKVCAVSDVWSGLKFVRRLADRQARSATSAGSAKLRVSESAKQSRSG